MNLKTRVIFLFMMVTFAACVQHEPSNDSAVPRNFYEQVSDTAVSYDSNFAAKLGADAYGMRPFVLAYLKRGPNRSHDSTTAANLQKAHLENIIRMAESGKLVLAGPFLDTGAVRGIYIFNVSTIEEAQELTSTDPAIQAGRLEMELHPWYGPAVLPLITPLSKRLEKTRITD